MNAVVSYRNGAGNCGLGTAEYALHHEKHGANLEFPAIRGVSGQDLLLHCVIVGSEHEPVAPRDPVWNPMCEFHNCL